MKMLRSNPLNARAFCGVLGAVQPPGHSRKHTTEGREGRVEPLGVQLQSPTTMRPLEWMEHRSIRVDGPPTNILAQVANHHCC